jgi:hypothetical protein
VTNPEIKALTRSRLSHVDQNYLRGDTIFSELRVDSGREHQAHGLVTSSRS